jgi:uncharacterized protein
MSILKQTKSLCALVATILSIGAETAALGRTYHQPAPPYPFTDQEVTFRNQKDRVRLAGTLSLPLSHGPLPAVVLCSGFGPQDRNANLLGHKLLVVLARHLVQRGIAVLRVDDRGVGKSMGNFSEATSEDFARDALAAIAYLKTRKEISHEQIGLLGHSEGGLVAPMAAAQSQDVAFVVMMAGPGLKGDQIVVGAGGADLEGGWLNKDLILQMRAAQQRVLDVVRSEGHCDGVDIKIMKEAEVFRAVAARIRLEAPESLKRSAEGVASAIEGQASFFLSPWFRFYFTYDPRTALAKLKCPVLAIYGARDIQVPAKENLNAVRQALDSGGNKDYTALVLPNHNHLFQTSRNGAINEYDHIDETVSVVALNTVSDWILKHTAFFSSAARKK